jgi:hypothetical protein
MRDKQSSTSAMSGTNETAAVNGGGGVFTLVAEGVSEGATERVELATVGVGCDGGFIPEDGAQLEVPDAGLIVEEFAAIDVGALAEGGVSEGATEGLTEGVELATIEVGCDGGFIPEDGAQSEVPDAGLIAEEIDGVGSETEQGLSLVTNTPRDEALTGA